MVLERIQVQKETALNQIHVVEGDNTLSIGVDAFPAMWDRLPYFYVFSPIWRFSLDYIPGVRPTMEYAYKRFVFSKFRRWMSTSMAAKASTDLDCDDNKCV